MNMKCVKRLHLIDVDCKPLLLCGCNAFAMLESDTVSLKTHGPLTAYYKVLMYLL